MINHYSSNVLHEAHRLDLLNEAKGGRLLKQAREAESAPGKPGGAQRVLFILLIGAALAIGALLLTFATARPAAASAPNISAIAGAWHGNMTFGDGNSVQRITPQPDSLLLHVQITPLFTAEGILKQGPNPNK